MNGPSPPGAPQSPPRLVGAALAACVITCVPGLTLLASSLEHAAPDLEALALELPLGGLAALLGSAQWSGGGTPVRGRAGAGAAVALLGYAFLTGVGMSMSEASHTTAPVFVVGLLLSVGVVALDGLAVAIAGAWLASLGRGVSADVAAGRDPRTRCARWLVIAAGVHVLVKGAAGGPVTFGVLAAAVAVGLARPARRQRLVTASVAVAVLGAAAQVLTRAHYARARARHEMPLCYSISPGPEPRANDVLATRARSIPGVADAVTFFPSATDPRKLTLSVLPKGAGPLTPELRQRVEADARAAPCVMDDEETKPDVTVEEARLVPLAIRARLRLAPGAGADEVKVAAEREIRRVVEERPDRIRTRDRPSYEPARPAGAAFAEFKADGEYFDTRIQQIAEGSVPGVGSIEVELLPPQP